ncbi:phosphoenolpyruvate--protein phosphotransferase, partial [Elusimicrobiota bacterium]
MKLKGIPASPGIAIGRAYLISERSYCAIKRNIDEKTIRREVSRFKRAISNTENEFRKQKEKVAHEMGRKYAHLWDAYMLILKDPLLYKDTLKIIVEEKVNVEYALQMVIDKITKIFSLLDDEYMRDRVRDVQDVGNKVMESLLGQERASLKELQTRIVAHTLTPSEIVEMKKENMIALVTDVGGKTSHIVIMAESMEIPAVVGLKTVTQEVSPGDLIIVDGNDGLVYINPEPELVREYRKKKRELEDVRKKLVELRDKPAVTKCGIEIDIAVNIETSDESYLVDQYGANGIGLYRTEYLYLNRTTLPSEDEIFESLHDVAKKIYPNPVVVRTLDLGADKVASQLNIHHEGSSFMGLRGIRLCLSYPGLFKTQLRAIIRASVLGNIRMMYPMISGIKEIKSANYILEEVKEELDNQGIEFNKNIPVGIMVETPAAALDIDHIAGEVDFFSIGTNDLIQYTLAVNRISETVSYLYNPADISILKLIYKTISCANKCNKWVSLCGEMSADTLYTELLLGMGLRKFSMSGIAIPKIKQLIRNTTISKSEELLRNVMSQHDTSRIVELLKYSSSFYGYASLP